MNEIVLTEHKSNYINTYYIFVCLSVCLFGCSIVCLYSYCTRQIKQLVWDSCSRSIICIQYVGVLLCSYVCLCVCVFVAVCKSLQPVDVVCCNSHMCKYMYYYHLGICFALCQSINIDS